VAGEKRMLKSIMICTYIMKNNEMGWECSTHERIEEAHTGFCCGNLRKEINWKT